VDLGVRSAAFFGRIVRFARLSTIRQQANVASDDPARLTLLLRKSRCLAASRCKSGRRHADPALDHQVREFLATNQDDALLDPVHVVSGLAAELGGRDEDALPRPKAFQATGERLNDGRSDPYPAPPLGFSRSSGLAVSTHCGLSLTVLSSDLVASTGMQLSARSISANASSLLPLHCCMTTPGPDNNDVASSCARRTTAGSKLTIPIGIGKPRVVSTGEWASTTQSRPGTRRTSTSAASARLGNPNGDLARVVERVRNTLACEQNLQLPVGSGHVSERVAQPLEEFPRTSL